MSAQVCSRLTSRPRSAVKLAKQVLRDHRNDLALWDGYARVERQRGRAADARQVYCTALSMYRSFRPQDQIDGPLLWRAWAEMEWEEGRPVIALKVLTAAASTDNVDLGASLSPPRSPTVPHADSVTRTASLASTDPDVRPSAPQLLRSRQHYVHELEAAFQPRATQALVRNRNHLAFSFALFQYLTSNLAAAVDVLERHLFRLDCAGATGSAEHEEALMMYAKLLFRHSAVGAGYRPAQLRELLERALGEFKSNSVFLALFYHNERASSLPPLARRLALLALELTRPRTDLAERMKIENHFRRLIEEKVLKENEATSEGWLFAIFAELHRDARSTNVWAVRNLFDRAIDNPRCARSSRSISPSSTSLLTQRLAGRGRRRRFGRSTSTSRCATARSAAPSHSSTAPSASAPGARVRLSLSLSLSSRASSHLSRRADSPTRARAEFYLRPFSPSLRPAFRSRELRDFHHLLLEKGLRVHVDVDAFLEGAVLSDMEDDDDEQDRALERLEDAGEDVLTERTRLMPY